MLSSNVCRGFQAGDWFLRHLCTSLHPRSTLHRFSLCQLNTLQNADKFSLYKNAPKKRHFLQTRSIEKNPLYLKAEPKIYWALLGPKSGVCQDWLSQVNSFSQCLFGRRKSNPQRVGKGLPVKRAPSHPLRTGSLPFSSLWGKSVPQFATVRGSCVVCKYGDLKSRTSEAAFWVQQRRNTQDHQVILQASQTKGQRSFQAPFPAICAYGTAAGKPPCSVVPRNLLGGYAAADRELA